MIKIMKFGEVSPDEVFARVEPTVNVEDIVTDIIANVQKNGDRALFEYCEKFDKAKLVPPRTSVSSIPVRSATASSSTMKTAS